MIGFVTLPTNFISLVSANAGTAFSDLAPVAMLIAGVLLGLFAINYVLSMFAQAREEAHFKRHMASLSEEERDEVETRARRIHTSEAVSEYEDLLDEETGD